MAWRNARCITTLRDELNAKWPARSKASDGTIGDAAHQKRKSDHNPNGAGVVRAIDITAAGIDSEAVVARVCQLGRSGHPALGSGAYIIHKSRIASPSTGWKLRPYNPSTGPHNAHIHISMATAAAGYDSTQPWDIDNAAAPAPTPTQARRLRKGDTGPDVGEVQERLNRDYPLYSHLAVDNSFGPATDAVVREFQRRAGLTVDGIVGPATRAALYL